MKLEPMGAGNLSLVLIAVLHLGCDRLSVGASGERSNEVATGRLEEPVSVGGMEIIVHEVVDPLVPRDVAEPTPGKRRVAVDVEMRHGNGGGAISYDASKWRVYDVDGFAFEGTTLGGDAKEPKLVAGALTPGNKTRGWVTFEVTETSKLQRVEYLTGYLSANVASFRLD
jgi:hypothetical protein